MGHGDEASTTISDEVSRQRVSADILASLSWRRLLAVSTPLALLSANSSNGNWDLSSIPFAPQQGAGSWAHPAAPSCWPPACWGLLQGAEHPWCGDYGEMGCLV